MRAACLALAALFVVRDAAAAAITGAPLQTGVIRGVVIELDLPEGVVVVQTPSAIVSLLATPPELAALRPGELVALPFAAYADARWITAGDAPFSGAYAYHGTRTGPIVALDKRLGGVALPDASFRIDPDALEGFVPGQLVRVSYVVVGDVAWATAIAFVEK